MPSPQPPIICVPQQAANRRGSTTQIGFVNSLGTLAGPVAFPVAGYIADHIGRVELILFGSLSSAIIVGVYFLAPTWRLLTVGAALQGPVMLMFPTRPALIADSLAPGYRGRGIAAMNTIMNTIAIFVPFIAGIIVDLYGPNTGVRPLYGVMLVMYLATAFVHLRYLKNPAPDTSERLEISSLPGVLKDTYRGIRTTPWELSRPLEALAAIIVLSFAADAGASLFWVIYAVEEITLTSCAWGVFLLIKGVLKLVLFMPAGL